MSFRPFDSLGREYGTAAGNPERSNSWFFTIRLCAQKWPRGQQHGDWRMLFISKAIKVFIACVQTPYFLPHAEKRHLRNAVPNRVPVSCCLVEYFAWIMENIGDRSTRLLRSWHMYVCRYFTFGLLTRCASNLFILRVICASLLGGVSRKTMLQANVQRSHICWGYCLIWHLCFLFARHF